MKKGDEVEWKFGKGKAEGKIVEINEHRTTKKIKEHEITRNGTKDNPALSIEQEDGDKVLKLKSELKKK